MLADRKRTAVEQLSREFAPCVSTTGMCNASLSTDAMLQKFAAVHYSDHYCLNWSAIYTQVAISG